MATEPTAASQYITVGASGSTDYIFSGSTITIGGVSPATSGPIAVTQTDVRKTVALELANAPYTVSAFEDEEGVRWVTIGCRKHTLERWRVRGERIIAAFHKGATAAERARLLKGLKVTLAALDVAFAGK